MSESHLCHPEYSKDLVVSHKLDEPSIRNERNRSHLVRVVALRSLCLNEILRGLRMTRASAHLPSGSVDSATISIKSRTRIESSSERDFNASSNIVMQNGHPTAIVFGFATLN